MSSALPDKINVIFKPPTIEALSSSPTRRQSVKDRIGQWEMNSIESHSDAGSVYSMRSGRSAGASLKSLSRKFERKQLFNLVLHIPMPDQSFQDYEVAVDATYDPTKIAREVCSQHGLEFNAVGTNIENQVNRLVAETCLTHTESFNDELDRTRSIAIEAHSKQQRDNIELKKRLVQAKKIIESYDRRLEKTKEEGKKKSTATGNADVVEAPESLYTESEFLAAQLAAQLAATVERYELQMENDRMNAEKEMKIMVELATSNLTRAHLEEMEELHQQLDTAERDASLLELKHLSEKKEQQVYQKTSESKDERSTRFEEFTEAATAEDITITSSSRL